MYVKTVVTYKGIPEKDSLNVVLGVKGCDKNVRFQEHFGTTLSGLI